MPKTRLALSLTDAYRARVEQLQQVLAAQTRMGWGRLDPADIDGSHRLWASSATVLTTAAQTQAVGLSVGYLSAFLTAELGEPTAAEPPKGDYIGVYRDGGPLPLDGTRIAVKVALKEGQTMARALAVGLKRALFVLHLAVDHAATQSLLDGINQDDRFAGWDRAVRGTCGACLGAANGPSGGLLFPKHPGCQCVASPRVRGVRHRYPVPTGAALFAAMTDDEQDTALGPEVAAAVRAGDVTLADLVAHNHQRRGPNFISQAPIDA